MRLRCTGLGELADAAELFDDWRLVSFLFCAPLRDLICVIDLGRSGSGCTSGSGCVTSFSSIPDAANGKLICICSYKTKTYVPSLMISLRTTDFSFERSSGSVSSTLSSFSAHSSPVLHGAVIQLERNLS
jgi:hypothetical protein